jgi:GNAT superfamily N-acetyltransferase
MDSHDSLQSVAAQLLNNRLYWLGYGRQERSDGGVALYRSGVRHGQLNGILRVEAGRFEEALAQAENFADLPWLWWVGPDSYPGLAGDLATAGAAEVGKLPVMAAHIDQLHEPVVPAGIVIEPFAATARLDEWVTGYAEPMGVPPDQIRAAALMETDDREAPEHLVRFAAWVDGRIVGTSALLARAGVAGVYVVAVQERFRRQGIGAALTWAAITEGRRRRLRVATLQASSMGRLVYERLGFRTVTEYRLYRLDRRDAAGASMRRPVPAP